jgi:ABC-type nickel/cobalt efflux system permease component RcnA
LLAFAPTDAGFVFSATASDMNRAARWLELLSYTSVAAIGLWLVWRKGGGARRGVS